MAVCRASNATERPAIPEHHGAPACLIPRAQGCQYIKVSSVQLCIPQIKTYIKPLACFGVTYPLPRLIQQLKKMTQQKYTQPFPNIAMVNRETLSQGYKISAPSIQ
jgi:hypothetical protein